jgi:hypothetical protein
MGNGGNEGWKAGLVGSAVLLAALVGPGVATVSAKSAPTRQMTVVERTGVAAAVADVALVASVDALEAAAAAPVPPTKQRRLRRLKHQELNMELILASADLIKRHHAKRIGSEIEVEIAGRPYVARIERHFHPEGGAIKPWGFHPGVSLFAVEWTSAT